MEEQVDPRRCEHVKEDGSRCKGWKAKGGSLCAGHAGIGVAANPREAASLSAAMRQGQAQGRQEKAQKGLRDLLRDRLEEKADVLVARAMDIVEHGSDSDALRAMESLMSRAYGKPTERVEHDVVAVDSVEAVASLSREERRRLIGDLRALRPAADVELGEDEVREV